MHEDETIKTYVHRITNITTCILKISKGTISEYEVCQKKLKDNNLNNNTYDIAEALITYINTIHKIDYIS